MVRTWLFACLRRSWLSRAGAAGVVATRPLQAPVGARKLKDECLMLLVKPIDEKPQTKGKTAPPPPCSRASSSQTRPEILETGIKVVDLIAPLAKVEKLACFVGAGVGKTVLINELIEQYR